ncbi:Thiamin diphosphate-binding protein [Kockovaella imperatae]|uniref:2-oxoglutarate dehydrogenase, mitochondrial n=1 Tax=Kockovaella imperatae TaxID=4999 RepID=A0A1Y1UQM3_9TREE|nr:Thiamin diphosphate-binding protein [Kockovaella imperatae]ORX39784.1 Thiamin diphosphate-binding protein [Kockovaella imperatae]
MMRIRPAARNLARQPLRTTTPCRQIASLSLLSHRASQPRTVTREYATEAATPPSPNDIFANGSNAYYVEEMYRHWKQDAKSVHVSWQTYFAGLDKGLPSASAYTPPPGIASGPAMASGAVSSIDVSANSGEVTDYLKVQLLVRAYQVTANHVAKLDPLGIADADLDTRTPPELKLEYYGWTKDDLSKEFKINSILPRFVGKVPDDTMTLGQIIDELTRMYCSHIGVQYVHITDRGQCDWIRERIEVPQQWNYTTEEKRMILDRTMWSELFEKFIASKYPNEKRFGLEGCESLIPGMKALIDRSVDAGVKSIVIGMPHRGRLNVLGNVIRKPIEAILNEFAGNADKDDSGGGDVKYHLGANYVRPTPSGKKVSLSLVANPSHLEAEDPVVLGKTRAIQHFEDDESSHTTAMGVLLHGDAAFAGQGVVYETMGMQNLPNYGTGGTIHLIVNNQIGFTTDPRFARSTPYPSDIAKAIDAPIFHVNGDDVEAVNFVCCLAADWRAKFKKDVVIDIVCYRRYGHNETDQPSFTQPFMYKAIQKQPTVLTLYTDKLIKEGTFTEKEVDEHRQWVWGMLEKAQDAARDYTPSPREWLSSSWEGFPTPKELAENVLPHLPTGSDEHTLKRVGEVISSFPEGFTPHKNLARIIASRGKAVSEGKGIDWSTAEALAFGALCLEGTHVRVSGQDVERGTFSQRHAVVHDQENEQTYVALKHLGSEQGSFTVTNSHLSEFGTLGFELGYSLVSPNSLTIWEAQFGDFSNSAQVIIDQFISSGERKWLQRTGLVMSLPHGYDGQGPEHSSGKIERFLSLVDDDPRVYPSPEKLERAHQDCNMQVVYPSTPSNLFHVLRRQNLRDFRKPLILFFSKSLLRHPLVKSDLSEFIGDSSFQRYLPETGTDDLVPPEQARRVLLCTGQVYYQLLKERQEKGIKDVHIARVEQLSPLPYELISPDLDKYGKDTEIFWVQEEPLNNGAWVYIQPRLQQILKRSEKHGHKVPIYVGRKPSSSVATGSKKAHAAEIAMINEQAFAQG